MIVKGEHLGPGRQLHGQGDESTPDLVGGEAVQGQIGQAGVLAGANTVLAAG
jgi:hypothetical protein